MRKNVLCWQMGVLLISITGCLSMGSTTGGTASPTQSAVPDQVATNTPSEPSTAPESSPDAASTPANPDTASADCSNPQTQVDMNTCAAKSASTADDQLNNVYKQLQSTLKSAESDRLVAAQRAWIEFRDKNCTFSSGRFEGGSMAPMVYSTCIERITKQRTEELAGYAKGIENGGLY